MLDSTQCQYLLVCQSGGMLDFVSINLWKHEIPGHQFCLSVSPWERLTLCGTHIMVCQSVGTLYLTNAQNLIIL